MLVVGDLSRTHGGEFGPRFGVLGHQSHQNGLDIDVYYARTDRALRPPARVSQIDHHLAADLLRRILAIGPRYIFVGPDTGLRGPPASSSRSFITTTTCTSDTQSVAARHWPAGRVSPDSQAQAFPPRRKERAVTLISGSAPSRRASTRWEPLP